MRNLIHEQRPLEMRVPKKRIHFVLAPEQVSDELSGFVHNGVSPFGMRTPIPIVLCNRIIECGCSYIYLGGGHVDSKLGIFVDDIMATFQPIVGKISEGR